MIEEPRHFAELCRQTGFVVLQAQILEHNLAMYLAVSLRLEKKEAEDQVQKALASANRKTIERLLDEISKKYPLDHELIARIWSVKEERNWLVHRLQREVPRVLFSDVEAQPVFDRIQRLAAEILAVLTELDKVGDRLMQKYGFDPVVIRNKSEESFRKKAAAGSA